MPFPEVDTRQPGSEPVDAIQLLKIDLQDVDGVVAKYWDVSHADDLEVRRGKAEVADEVTRRSREFLALEEAFLRATEGSIADEALLRQMRAGQSRALALVEEIERADPADHQRDAAVRVLGDFMLKHADGELEGVFRHVAASRLNLFDLGEQLRQQRAEGALGQGVAPRRLPEPGTPATPPGR